MGGRRPLRPLAAAAGLALCLAALAACGGPATAPPPASPAPSQAPPPRDPNFPVTVAGVEIPEKPDRVVSLGPSVTEICCDLGVQAALCGVSGGEVYPQEAQSLPRCGNALLPEVEAILGLEAQVVLSVGPLPAAERRRLEQGRALVVQLDKPTDIGGLPAYYRDIARVFLGEEAGARAGQDFSDAMFGAMDAIEEAAAQGEGPEGAFMALLPLTLATGDSMQGALLEKCGIKNAAADYRDWQYPEELLLPFNPQVLVADTRTVTVEEIAAHPNYKTTPCVLNGRVLGLDGSAIENCGSRLLEAMLEMARLARPGIALPESAAELLAAQKTA